MKTSFSGSDTQSEITALQYGDSATVVASTTSLDFEDIPSNEENQKRDSKTDVNSNQPGKFNFVNSLDDHMFVNDGYYDRK